MTQARPDARVTTPTAACDAEFEAYGAVLLLDGARLEIVNATANCQAVVGVDATALIGRRLDAVIEDYAVAELERQLHSTGGELGWYRTRLISGDAVKLHGFRSADGEIGLDIVPVSASMLSYGAEALERVASWTERLLAVDEPLELLQLAASHVAELTGYGGAWVCRIEDDANGIVVATDAPGVSDTVGQSVLAIDMPPGQPSLRGRALPFFVADLDAAPVGLVLTPRPEATTDASSLHRPYPAYLQRKHDIGVRATLSVPITVAGQLWGRIIAHHPEPRRVSPAIQSELRLLGAAISTHLTELLQLHEAREQLVYAQRSAAILRSVARSADIFDGLVADVPALLALCGTPSALVSIEGTNAVVGDGLDPVQREHLLALARAELAGPDGPPVVASASVSVPIAGPSAPWTPGGYLAMKLGDDARNVIVWIRPETERTVTWVDHSPDGPAENLFDEMSRRVERRRGTSEPWTAAQIQGVTEFRADLAARTVDRYQQLAQRATALTRSNEEFNAFAYTAAHDLKQPIRGIRQYTEFFLEDTEHKLDEDERGQLETILRLSSRMNMLVDDLMRYAELGDASWLPLRVDLPTAVDEALELLPPEETASASIVVDSGDVCADPSALRQLLMNLIGNALKYAGDRPASVQVSLTTLGAVAGSAPETIGELPPDTCVLAVRDEGIGIVAKHHEEVFGLFRQLDTDSPGSGAGLAMCRRIAHRHGGEIWLISEPGRGTTVFVALDDQAR